VPAQTARIACAAALPRPRFETPLCSVFRHAACKIVASGRGINRININALKDIGRVDVEFDSATSKRETWGKPPLN